MYVHSRQVRWGHQSLGLYPRLVAPNQSTVPPLSPASVVQGLQALGLFRDFIARGISSVQDLADPIKFQEKMQAYANTTDPVLKNLYAEVAKGNETAAQELHQAIVDLEWNKGEALLRLGVGETGRSILM